MSDLTRRIADLPPEKRELLLRRLAEKNQGTAPPALPEITPDPANLGLPFDQTYVQQAYRIGRSGYFDISDCGTNFYTEYEVTGGGAPMLERFNSALRRLIARHDVFRTVLLEDGRQRILTEVPPYEMAVIDLREATPDEAEARLDADRRRMKFDPADLYTWPLFEFAAYLLADGRIRILSRIEALILDGTSNGLFNKELFLLLEDPDLHLAPYSCTFRDYGLGVEAVRNTELYAKSRAYWLERVKSLPPAPELPTVIHLGPETDVHHVGRADYMLSPEEWNRFKARAARASLTPSSVVLTALTEVLAAWSATPKFTISLVASYRFPIHPDINQMVGNFNSISLLAVDTAGGTFQERARRLQLQLSSDLEHMYFPGFAVIQEWNRLQGAGTRSASPILANSLIEYSHSVYEARSLDRGGAETEVGSIAIVDGHFTIPQIMIEPIFGVEPDGSLASQWFSLDSAYPPGMVGDLFAALKALLKRLADDESAWGERSLHLYRREASAIDAAVPPLVRRVAPDVLRQAAGFTAQIREAGLAPGDVVAWLAEDGADPLAALLGTWDAGCTFLPLDPAWSEAELQAALEQSGAAMVLDPGALGASAVSEPVPFDPERTACLLWRPGQTPARYSHRSLAATIGGIAQQLGLGPTDRIAVAAPPVTDLWLTAALLALATGAALTDEQPTLLLGRPALVSAPSCRTLLSEDLIGPANLAGSTETALWTLLDGRPLPGFRVQVLSAAHEDRPDYVPGQLWIDGAPTGRRARYLDGGRVELLGPEVRVNGYRFALADLQKALVDHPQVRAAVVTPAAAYVVPAGPGLGAGDLTRHLRSQLPGYMIPAQIILLDALPLTATGAVDLSGLPEPAAPAAGHVAPRDESEAAMARLWQEVLGIAGPVGVTENFFSLGGTSLTAIRLVAAIAARFGCKLPFTAFADGPTVEHFARVIRGQ